jgi:L-carnitine/gamma-butyrobetaine antiporter
MKKLKFEPAVFFPTILAVILFCVWVGLSPVKANETLLKMYGFITDKLCWFIQLVMVAALGGGLYFALSKYGNKKLGDEEPEFTTLSWLGMMFTGVAGLGLLTWGTIEVYWHMAYPVYGNEPFSNDAMSWALSYPYFHWGFSAYGIYSFLGLIFAYIFYVKKKDVIRPSSACTPLLSEKACSGWLGKLIDILFVFGLVGGIATSLGVNTPTMFAVINNVTGMKPSLGADSAIILSWTVVMAVLLYTGLKKGIKFLSDFRVYFMFVLLLFIFLLGPTFEYLNYTVDTLGHMMTNFFRMSFTADPFHQSRVPQDWTIFYFAWYIALSIQSAIWFARISKGRTVKEFIFGSICASVLGGWAVFMIFSNHTMLTLNAGVDVAKVMAEGGQGAAIVEIWKYLPFAKILLPCLMLYAYISMQTFLNGTTYTLAMVTSSVNSSEEEPPRWIRIFWSLALGGIAVALTYMGGIKVAQSMTIITALPSLVIIFLITAAFFKDIQTWEDQPESSKSDRGGGEHQEGLRGLWAPQALLLILFPASVL